MTLLAQLAPGVHLYDRRTGQERLVDKVEVVNQVVFLSFNHPRTGEIDCQPFPLTELESCFELLTIETVAFRARPEIVTLVVEVHRRRHAYLFNRLCATQPPLIERPVCRRRERGKATRHGRPALATLFAQQGLRGPSVWPN